MQIQDAKKGIFEKQLTLASYAMDSRGQEKEGRMNRRQISNRFYLVPLMKACFRERSPLMWRAFDLSRQRRGDKQTCLQLLS